MESAQRNSVVTAFAPVSELHAVPSGSAGSESGGTLVSAVRALRELEDDILGVLTDSDRLFYFLGAQRIHEDAGFASFDQMERRLLHPSSMLRALRMAVPRPAYQPPKSGRRRKAEARAANERARRINGLSVLTHALTGLRALEERLRELADSARAGIDEIELQSLYEDCGYSSMEEFIARALAPSPVLSVVAALAAEEPPPLPQQDALSAGPPPSGTMAAVPSGGFVDLADVSMLEPQAGPGNDFTAVSDPAEPAARGSRAPQPAAPVAKPSKGTVIVSIALAVVAGLAGGAAGFFL